MVDLVTVLELGGSALGVLGAGLLFAEFFQMPSYLNYRSEHDGYNLEMAPANAQEYTWIGRTGALLVAMAFALEFVATLLA